MLLFSITAISAVDLNDTDVSQDNGTNEKSFTELRSKINSANSNFSLKSDYAFNTESDNKHSSGILINKDDFIIDGNNHTIDCKNQSRVFYITGNMV